MGSEPRIRDETLTLNGLRFHYRDWGNPQASPLVLLHGYTSHARSWDTIARRLADRFRVLALDQRGHGESEHAADYDEQRLLEDLAAFVDALGLATFAPVGFSIGGSPPPATPCSTRSGSSGSCWPSASPWRPIRMRRPTSRPCARCRRRLRDRRSAPPRRRRRRSGRWHLKRRRTNGGAGCSAAWPRGRTAAGAGAMTRYYVPLVRPAA